jgi:hypothetical protein
VLVEGLISIENLFLRLLSGSRIASGALALAAALFASSARAATPMAPVQQPACWAPSAESCLLFAPYRGLAMSIEPNAGLIAYLGKQGIQKTDRAITIDADINSRVEGGEYTSDEGATILGELAGFDGAAYILPEQEELKRSLGFPEGTEFASEDIPELIRVHIQYALSVSPLTAAYLSNRLEVARVEVALAPSLESAPAAILQPAPVSDSALDQAPAHTPEAE